MTLLTAAAPSDVPLATDVRLATDVPPAADVPPATDRAVTVPICGALDAPTLARVRDTLEQALRTHPPHLVVDLTDCPFVDASALAMLLELHRRLARSGGLLTLRGCSPRVLRLLSLTGLRRVFDLA